MLSKKAKTLLLLSIAELLGMSVWFSASAVVPVLTNLWGLDDSGRAWLTMSVQIGFVIGAFGSAVFNLADRVPANRLFAGSALLAGLATILIPITNSMLPLTVLLRLTSGFFLAGVYPVGMKIMATWTKEDRGLGIGLLVGALTLGSAAPHLINAFGKVDTWQPVLYLAGGLAIIGGLIALLFITEGPYQSKTPPFEWGYLKKLFRQQDIFLANVGYLGHMWELYAMWTWIPVFLLASFQKSGISPSWASGWAFVVVGSGGVGSALAGRLADRFGRTRIAIWSMIISGGCALIIGQFYGKTPAILALISLVWGLTVVSDSAQFSACVSELAEKEYIGTALTIQTSLGFLLTLITIRLIPTLESLVGWRWAFTFLVIGPLVGIWAMTLLKKSDSAIKLANGKG